VASPAVPDPRRFPVPASFETPRLFLRPFAVADAPQLHEALVESIDALREHLWFLPWVAEPPTPASAEARCRQAQADFLQRADLPYLAFERRSGRLVASAGMHRTDWALPATEVGYWVRTSEVGQGYATEAVNALTTWALEGLGATRVALVADERNVASRAVALRCGFRLEGVLRHAARSPDGRLRDTCLYAKLPADG
jgi:RimJ/RimL family protein N-acetyltransferase